MIHNLLNDITRYNKIVVRRQLDDHIVIFSLWMVLLDIMYLIGVMNIFILTFYIQ